MEVLPLGDRGHCTLHFGDRRVKFVNFAWTGECLVCLLVLGPVSVLSYFGSDEEMGVTTQSSGALSTHLIFEARPCVLPPRAMLTGRRAELTDY